MKSDIAIIDTFLPNGDDAVGLFAFLQEQEHSRPPNGHWSSPKHPSNKRRFMYPGYSVNPTSHGGYPTVPIAEVPKMIRDYVIDPISEHCGKTINYTSTNGYPTAHDGMNFHQHEEDQVGGENSVPNLDGYYVLDQTVYVLSLGETREITVRPIGSRDKSEYEHYFVKHNSLYILSHAMNMTHEHEVTESKTPVGLRIAVNCKHYDRITGPRVFDCHAGKIYPPDAVYVGRVVRDRKTGKITRPGTIFGNPGISAERFPAYVADALFDPAYRAAFEALRGKNLLCYCGPEAPFCHAKYLLQQANSQFKEAL
jgi:hypothetical protein